MEQRKTRDKMEAWLGQFKITLACTMSHKTRTSGGLWGKRPMTNIQWLWDTFSQSFQVSEKWGLIQRIMLMSNKHWTAGRPGPSGYYGIWQINHNPLDAHCCQNLFSYLVDRIIHPLNNSGQWRILMTHTCSTLSDSLIIIHEKKKKK